MVDGTFSSHLNILKDYHFLPLQKSPGSLVVPPCPRCSSPRFYEFQLMPNLLPCLQSRYRWIQSGWSFMGPIHLLSFCSLRMTRTDLLQSFIENSSWGTVAVFSCTLRMDAYHSSPCLLPFTSLQVQMIAMWSSRRCCVKNTSLLHQEFDPSLQFLIDSQQPK